MLCGSGGEADETKFALFGFCWTRLHREWKGTKSLSLLLTKLGMGVGDTNVQLLRTLHNLLALAGGDVVGNLGTVLSVVQEEHVELSNVVHAELVEAVGEEVTGLLVAAIADVGHLDLPTEPPAHTSVNTLGLAPRLLLGPERGERRQGARAGSEGRERVKEGESEGGRE